MEKNTDSNTFTLRDNADIGTVKIANDVIGMIAALAAMEIDGVSAMAGNITSELMSRVGYRNLSKGVKVLYSTAIRFVWILSILMGYGYNIPATCQKAQTRVKTAVENMTGLEVVDVNIRIAGITMPQA
jgi:uncharacterized alkaline shock family protein YloU